MSLEAKLFMQHKFSQRWRENLNNSWFHTLLEDIIFLNGYFKTQNIASLLLAFFSVGFSMHKKELKVHSYAQHSLVENLQWVKHEQTRPFLRCHLTLSLLSVLGPSEPHLQSLLSQSHGKGQLSLTGIPSGLSVREEILTRTAQADTHLKPSQFNEAQHVDSNKPCLPLCSYRTVSKPCWMRLFSRRSGRWSR